MSTNIVGVGCTIPNEARAQARLAKSLGETQRYAPRRRTHDEQGRISNHAAAPDNTAPHQRQGTRLRTCGTEPIYRARRRRNPCARKSEVIGAAPHVRRRRRTRIHDKRSKPCSKSSPPRTSADECTSTNPVGLMTLSPSPVTSPVIQDGRVKSPFGET